MIFASKVIAASEYMLTVNFPHPKYDICRHTVMSYINLHMNFYIKLYIHSHIYVYICCVCLVMYAITQHQMLSDMNY
jgi:hypothetical protein